MKTINLDRLHAVLLGDLVGRSVGNSLAFWMGACDMAMKRFQLLSTNLYRIAKSCMSRPGITTAQT